MKYGIDAVIFDIGNVINRVDFMGMAARLAKHSPLSAAEVRAAVWGTGLELEIETGQYDSREYFRRIKDLIRGEDAWDFETFVEEYKSGLSMTSEGKEALELASQSKRVFLLSNTPYLHALWVFEQEILATLPEFSIFSYQEGVMKPDPRIWQILLERAKLKAEDCLFIDDTLNNCKAAATLGMKTIHFKAAEANLLHEVRKWL